MNLRRIVVFLIVMCGLLLGLVPVGVWAETCPRPTPMTAPSVGPWFRFVHAPTYQHIDVHFTLHDQYGDPESPLYLYQAADGVWASTVNFDYQVTPCLEQYRQLVDFSLRVLNDGKRPFTFDNHETVAEYETFLLGVHGFIYYLPYMENGR